MIINHSVLNRLSPGILEATPELGDNIIRIPPSFNFVGLPPEPMYRALPLTGKQFESSFSLQSNMSVANAVQAVTGIGVLTSGWWKLHFRGVYRSNYVEAAVNPGDYRFLLTDSVSNWQVVTMWAQLAGTQIINQDFELFIAQTYAMTHILDANAVGQSHAVCLSVSGNKLL